MRAGRGHLGRPPGAEKRLLRAHLGVHNILHNPHTLPRVCAQGAICAIECIIVGEMKFHYGNGQ